MTTRDARLTLSLGPLRFGDPAQVKALQFLEDVGKARAELAICEHRKCGLCDGKGAAGLALCEYCGGDGTELPCRCFDGLDGWAIVEARKQMKGGK